MGKKSQVILAKWEGILRKGFLEKGATEGQFMETWLVMMEFAKWLNK